MLWYRPTAVRILIIHPGFLGDALFLGPAIRALKLHWPDSRIAVCLTPRGAPVGRLLPGADEVIVYDKRGADRGVLGLLRTGRSLRAFRPDVALISHRSLRSGLLGWLSRAPRRIGYAPLCTERVPFPAGTFPDRLLNCVAKLGVATEDRALGLRVPEDQVAYLEAALGGAGSPLVALVPGAEHATKRWGASHFGQLAGRLARRGVSVVLLGGPAERLLAREVRNAAGPGAIWDLVGNTVEEAVAVISRCDVVIGGDTGLVHCARALGKRALVLFGPTPPVRHVLTKTDRFVHLSLDCQPCHRSGQPKCPLGHHRCMVDLSVGQVELALREHCPELAL